MVVVGGVVGVRGSDCGDISGIAGHGDCVVRTGSGYDL